MSLLQSAQLDLTSSPLWLAWWQASCWSALPSCSSGSCSWSSMTVENLPSLRRKRWMPSGTRWVCQPSENEQGVRVLTHWEQGGATAINEWFASQSFLCTPSAMQMWVWNWLSKWRLGRFLWRRRKTGGQVKVKYLPLWKILYWKLLGLRSSGYL